MLYYIVLGFIMVALFSLGFLTGRELPRVERRAPPPPTGRPIWTEPPSIRWKNDREKEQER